MTTAIPTTTNEFEEFLGDGAKVANSLKDGSFKDVVKAYAKNAMTEDIKAQVIEQTQLALADMLAENGAAISNKLGNLDFDKGNDNDYSKIENKKAIGAPLNGIFNNAGDYLKAVWDVERRVANKDTADKVEKIRNYYSEREPSAGGFLVPEEFRAELLRTSLETAVVRPRARVVPMSSLTLKFPMVDSSSNVSSVFGGIQVYRTEEGADLVESQAKFASIKLEATKQTAYALVTNELVRDAAGGFNMYIQELFPEAMADAEDRDFLNGTGVGEPLGALNAANNALVVVAKETSQTAATINYANIAKMYGRMLPSSLGRAVWVVSTDALAGLLTMTGPDNALVWVPNANGAPTLTLLGRPVIISEKAPGALGAQGDISFVDFGMYLIGDRQEMTVDSSPHAAFAQDKTAFRVIQRNDGRPWLQSAITPTNGSTLTLSPFVQLAVRA